MSYDGDTQRNYSMHANYLTVEKVQKSTTIQGVIVLVL